ncbi:Protein-ADP-ribose hydrolase [Candida viswanathii]|uniref:Protein-ADP-ribose hydrolase n=1 Tax=Candida viswanathii TaxID=5486 RepID=A0A367XMW7_9ASCO|nr:Protein-ADP-ribose hydrolase [Candida viswanathii]
MINIIKILKYLIEESNDVQWKSHFVEHLYNMESYHQHEMIRILLCKRDPRTPIPDAINQEINKFIAWQNTNKLHTSTKSLTNNYLLPNNTTKVSLWRGDITSLTDVTAIVNAANLALLGCFQPQHKCIDNVIHTAAGPDLRRACFDLMRGGHEPTGSARITPGFNLPAEYVIHTVGPIIHNGDVAERQVRELQGCYRSALEVLEGVDGHGKEKSIAFCCISTGIFAFPKDLASEIAVRTVSEYFETHPESSIQHVIFNVFLEEDEQIYQKNLDKSRKLPSNVVVPKPEPNIERAQSWIQEADYLLISAGAGLSASEGLDYSSRELFLREYEPFLKYDIQYLYGTIGYPWPTTVEFWNFFVYHYTNLYHKWPRTGSYERLRGLSEKFRDFFVVTSNADGFFVKNGFESGKVLTIQGNYASIQCLVNCRPDAYRPMEEMVDKYPLSTPEDIPRCHFCGSEMTMFLRMGDHFNQEIVRAQRDNYREFMRDVLATRKKVVILELGVGLNTPSVLRWPNEEKVERYPDHFKMIRVGTGPSSAIPMNILENTIVINADVKQAIELLTT